jgi:hypothetical protein
LVLSGPDCCGTTRSSWIMLTTSYGCIRLTLPPRRARLRAVTRWPSHWKRGGPSLSLLSTPCPCSCCLTRGHLDADFAQNLAAGIRPTGSQRETLLVPGGRVTARRATLPLLQVGTRTWRNIPLVLAPPVKYRSGRALPYQGVLGEAFLSREPLVSFHFGRRQLYFLTPSKP